MANVDMSLDPWHELIILCPPKINISKDFLRAQYDAIFPMISKPG